MSVLDDIGPGSSRPWMIANGFCFADIVVLPAVPESLGFLAGVQKMAAVGKSDCQIDQWWDGNLQASRALVRWGAGVGQGGVVRLPDGGVRVMYPDGRVSV